MGACSGFRPQLSGDRMTRSRLHLVRWTWLLGTVLTVVAGGVARGQSSPSSAAPAARLSESLTGQARDEYESGRVLFENRDYVGALVKFQRAFDLSGDVRLLWNMGACEKNLRHYTRVLVLVEQFLRDGGARLTATQRDEAAAILRTVRPLIGEIELAANEPGAAVYLDDAPVGTTPLKEPMRADLGDRRIRVSKPGFKEQTAVAHVTGGAKTALSVTLQREIHEGHLLVATDAGAVIEVDGKAVGVGRWQGVVEPGTHALRIAAPEMQPYGAELVVRDGESRSVDVTLRKESKDTSKWWWIGGAAVAAGLGVGGYFLLRPTTTTSDPMDGTINPYRIVVQAPH